MSNRSQHSSRGFTLVELLITIVIIGLVSMTFIVIFKSTIFNSINLQLDASKAVELNSSAQRVGMVLRGVTGITSATGDDLVVTAYFYPSDQYVSLLHYYITTDAKGNKKLMADLTPYSANPPVGSPVTAKKRTFTVIGDYYSTSGVTLFTYLDASNNSLSLPISDLQSIKGIRVALAAKTSNGSNQSLNVQVSLRNRKTNL
jgi:prepilin-type N-terminal cleavage/methylation domain-containing protein